MKYLLSIALLLQLGCSDFIPKLEKKYASIKYGDKFSVDDDFYGKGKCVVYKKVYLTFYYIHGDCTFQNIKNNMVYRLKDVKLEKQ